MNLADLAGVAAVLVPIVVLLSFAGCGFDGVAAGEPDAPPKPPDLPTPPPSGPPVGPPVTTPVNYHDLVLKGPTEVIAYWKLGDTVVGGAAADSGPDPKNPGIYRAGVALANGVLRLGPDATDQATAFDGTTGFVNVPYDTVMNPVSNTNFSVEAWIKPETLAPARSVVVGSYRVSAAGTIDRGFVVEYLGGPTPTVRARTAPDGLAEITLPFGGSGWNHVVLTYDGAAKRLQLYADGLSPATAVDTAASYTANRQTSPTEIATPLRIGAGHKEPFEPATPAALFFLGAIDQVALYRGILTQAIVQQHFTAATTP